MRHPVLAMLTLVLAACAAPMSGGPRTLQTWSFRVVAPETREEVTLATVLQWAKAADVIVFGEQHDDPETHHAELELIEAIGRTGRPIVLSLEMFERDVQGVLDEYLAGGIGEAAFLEGSRPWPHYASDYRPMVELAKARGWPVIAANVPRPLASAVARGGLAALDSLEAPERAYAAREIECPDDAYRARFMEEMRSHAPRTGTGAPSSDTMPTAMAQRFYLAQCVKDETMAESIVRALRAAPADAIVVHYTGAFHSDFAQGTVARIGRRVADVEVITITAIPVPDPASAPIAPQAGRADFVIFTRRAPPADAHPDARSLP